MDSIIFILVVSSLLCIQVSSQQCADVVSNIQDLYNQVSETDPAGTVIFSASKGPKDNITYIITNRNETIMQPYFRHFQNDTLYEFLLNRALDLEELYNIFGDESQLINFDFTCDRIIKRTAIFIKPENEFDPFINITGDLSIPENTTVGTVVYKLNGRAFDKDIPTSTFLFNISSTGGKTFGLVSANTGDIRLETPLDFESGHISYILNVSVKDNVGNAARTGYALLRINIIDVDDQGPQFDFPGCTRTCLVPEYTAITDLSYTGPLSVQPTAIKARDLDTLDLSITYSIVDDSEGGSSNDASSYFFRIDRSDGTIYQLRPAMQALWATKRIVIRAAEVGSSQPAALAIIKVTVRQRDPTINGTTIVQGEGKTVTVKDDSLLSAVIAVSVLSGLILIASVIVIYLMRRKRREIVSPEDTNSEPPTEEEEVYSERSEQGTFRNQNVSSTKAKTKDAHFLTSGTDPITDPTFLNSSLYRHGLLPPLPMKDTGTGTDSKRMNKRSRRKLKKKKQDNEIFDGTRQYNMTADPEFFESSDKSKIKRSTRSFKLQTKHIVVNNDNAELEE